MGTTAILNSELGQISGPLFDWLRHFGERFIPLGHVGRSRATLHRVEQVMRDGPPFLPNWCV